ncbi:MAG: hypothetical protein KAT68_19515 [Bacteroidales bacterium]|nr:hypothetical protein [Bacteroidales bacterium]
MKDKILVDINKIVSKEITDKTIDLTIDYSEIGLDSFIEDGILKEIPLVKSILSFYNIANSVIDRHKTQKILSFFKEFHSQSINKEKLNNFKNKFNEDVNFQNRVVELIILLNERFLHVEKSKILANLIIAHIEEHISWEKLLDITFVLDNIHPNGFDFLKKMSIQKYPWSSNEFRFIEEESLMFACGIGLRQGNRFQITEMGKILYDYGIKPLRKI